MRLIVNLVVSVTLLAAASMAEARCFRCDPILNISQAPVVTPQGKAATAEQVKAAIVRAGAALGWQMKDEGNGKISASITLRTHAATIAIPYSTSSYSITYVSSINLDDEGDGKIHKNYNGWIQNLNKGIVTQLSLL